MLKTASSISRWSSSIHRHTAPPAQGPFENLGRSNTQVDGAGLRTGNTDMRYAEFKAGRATQFWPPLHAGLASPVTANGIQKRPQRRRPGGSLRDHERRGYGVARDSGIPKYAHECCGAERNSLRDRHVYLEGDRGAWCDFPHGSAIESVAPHDHLRAEKLVVVRTWTQPVIQVVGVRDGHVINERRPRLHLWGRIDRDVDRDVRRATRPLDANRAERSARQSRVVRVAVAQHVVPPGDRK